MSDVDDLLAAALRRPARTRVVAVDGPAGAGKTTMAAEVASELEHRTGQRPPVVHMDDVFPGWDGLAVAPGLLVRWVLEPLSAGRDGAFRRWDWERSARAEEVRVAAGDWVVVEGVSCGSRVCRPHLAALAWVEAPHDIRMQRGIERDGEAFAPHWERWARQEEALFARERTRGMADVIRNTSAGI